MLPDRHGGHLADQTTHDITIGIAADHRHLRATCAVCDWATTIATGHTVAELQRLTDHHNGRPT